MQQSFCARHPRLTADLSNNARFRPNWLSLLRGEERFWNVEVLRSECGDLGTGQGDRP